MSQITEVRIMKLKSNLGLISMSLMVVVLNLALSSQLSAQSFSYKTKATKAMVAKKTPDESVIYMPSAAEIAAAPAVDKPETVQKTTSSHKNADYWFDRGALCATYGNDLAAITYFNRALALDPKRSDAYFGQGISYGQLGEFDKAVALIDKAVEMEPDNGLYLYGRGRVYLLAGKNDHAMKNFKRAAELDDEDAQNYLELQAQAD